MNIPTTYTEWVEALKYISEHPKNDMYIENLNKGSLEYDDVLIERLHWEFNKCIFSRLGKEVESFTRYLKGPIDYNSFSLKVVELRKELLYGRKLANVNVLPQKMREELVSHIMDNANTIQDLLVSQTDRIDKTGTINSIIKNNPINRFN